MTTTTVPATAAPAVPTTASREGVARAACLAGSALAIGSLVAVGDVLAGSTGQGVTDGLESSATRLQVAGILGVLAGSSLLLAAVRLGQRIGGQAGLLGGAAGALVAVLLSAYYASYAAGAVVGSVMLDDVGPGLGEATLVLVNVVEMTRFAPGLVLACAAVAARDRLPKPLVWTAAALAFFTAVPFTSWAAAIALPIWLGVAGALRNRS